MMKAKTILKELTHPLNKQFLLSSRSGKIKMKITFYKKKIAIVN